MSTKMTEAEALKKLEEAAREVERAEAVLGKANRAWSKARQVYDEIVRDNWSDGLPFQYQR
jgi:exonuclease VII small subunit